MSRSLAACTRCRRLKVRCASAPSSAPCPRCAGSGVGAECVFVLPRQGRGGEVAQSDERERIPVGGADQIKRIERLEILVRMLSSEVTSVKGEVSALQNGREERGGDLVAKGIITEECCAELFKFFHQHCNDTISFFDAIDPSLSRVRQTPILIAAVCSVGAKASGSALYDVCKAETEALVMQSMLSPSPTLEALKGMLLHAVWQHSTRLCGHILAVAYELGVHKAAEELATSTEMDAERVDMARTWLTFCCVDLLRNLTGPLLINNYAAYIDLGAALCASQHSRTVDYRIRANLELFGIVQQAKSLPSNITCSMPLPENIASEIEALSTKVDQWLAKVNTHIEPLYQTFSKPQDRNRMIIPYAAMRMYINGVTIYSASSELFIHPSHHGIIKTGIEAGLTVLETALASQNFRRTLRYAIGYNGNALYHSINFLYKAALMIYREIAIDNIIETFQRLVTMLDAASVPEHAQNVREKASRLLQAATSSPSSWVNHGVSAQNTIVDVDITNSLMWDQFPIFDGFSCEYPEGTFATPT